MEALFAGVRPKLLENTWPVLIRSLESFGAQQGPGLHAGNQGGQGVGLRLVDASHKVMKIKLFGVIQTGGLGDFLQGLQCVVVKVLDSLGLVTHDQGDLSLGVLCGDPSGAVARVTRLSLDTAQGKHETPCTVAPIRTQGQGSGNVKGGDDFATRSNPNLVPEFEADQGVVNQAQAFLHGRAHVIGKLQWRGSSTAL